MGETRVISAGEHAPRIAAEEGFGDLKHVWDAPQNAELKRTRDPCVLNPGDELFVPDKQANQFAVATSKTHTFVIKRLKIRLRVALRDASNRPLANVPCKLRYGGVTTALILDGNGALDQEIPFDTDPCTLSLPDRDISLSVGHLAPFDQPAGLRARLNNLGYHVDATDEESEGTDEALRSAVEEFQCDHDLTVDGKCGPKTRAKLKEIYGC
jgi:hypothetical protein